MHHLHHFLEDYDRNILSCMFPDGWKSLREEAKEESIPPNDELLKTEKELGDVDAVGLVWVHRY
jgi:hypothetical protein